MTTSYSLIYNRQVIVEIDYQPGIEIVWWGTQTEFAASKYAE